MSSGLGDHTRIAYFIVPVHEVILRDAAECVLLFANSRGSDLC